MSNYIHFPKAKYFTHFKELAGVRYGLFAEEKVKDLILEIANEEFDPEDFKIYGNLENLNWKLEEVNIDDITTRPDLMKDSDFLKSLDLRVTSHTDVHKQKIAVPPLILRGADLLIFDGYARVHTFKKLGIKKALAYVGKRVY